MLIVDDLDLFLIDCVPDSIPYRQVYNWESIWTNFGTIWGKWSGLQIKPLLETSWVARGVGVNVFLELRRYNCDQVSACGRGWGRKDKGRKRRGTDPSVGMVECANGMCSNKHWHNKIRGQKIKQAFKPTQARVKFQFSFFLSDSFITFSFYFWLGNLQKSWIDHFSVCQIKFESK